MSDAAGVRLQACLNGARAAGVPVTAQELGREAAACVAEGADGLHLHPRAGDGRETLAPDACDAAVAAVRMSGGEVSLTTGAWIVPDVRERLAAIRAWRMPPDVCSVNLGEDGAAEVCEALGERGIRVEAGLASIDDVARLAAVAHHCCRALVEVPDRDGAAAVAHAQRIDDAIAAAGIDLPRLWHGQEAATWDVLRAARAAGRAIRVGLEDVLELPDGTPARGNAALVRAAQALQAGSARE